jgi:Secretion system C-terminal sorting domain
MRKTYALLLCSLFICSIAFSQVMQTPNNAAEVTSLSTSINNTPFNGKIPDYSSQGNKGILYENGPLITHPTSGPSGAAFSLLQGDSLNSLGMGYQINSYNMVGDDFVCSANWDLDSIVFFGYQTNSPLTSTFQTHHFMILDGHPDSAATQLVFGDTTTNVLIDTYWSGIYRGSDTTSTARPIMRNVCDADGCTLTPGTYYIIWRAQGSLTSGPWAPPISILGTYATGDALQYTTAWALIDDGGFHQGLPFEIHGSMPGASVSEKDINTLNMYPNPTNGTVNISNAKNATINVYSIIGELVFSDLINSDEYTLHLDKQQNGMYIVQTNKDNVIQQQKLILNK